MDTIVLFLIRHALARRGFLTGQHSFSIPSEATVTIVHGRQDKTIPLSDSTTLSNLGDQGQVELVVVDDDHRLSQTLKRRRLEEFVLEIQKNHVLYGERGGQGSSSSRKNSGAGLLESHD